MSGTLARMNILCTALPSLALFFALPPARIPAQHSASAPHASSHAAFHDDMHMDKPPVPPSHALNVAFGGHVVHLTMEDLLRLPQTKVHVHNMHTTTEETYSGPLLSEVLGRAGLVYSKETEPTILHSAIIATGTDRYYALFSVGEVMPQFSHNQVIVAVAKSGLPDTAGGLIQIINTDGANPARWVHGLEDLNVITLEAKFTSQPARMNTPAPYAH